MTKSCWNWLKWKFVNFCLSTTSPGDDTPIVRGSALKALEGDAEWEAKIIELAGFWILTFRNQSVRLTRPFLLPDRRRILHLRSWYRCYRRVERGIIKVGEEVEIVGIKETQSLPVLALKCSANCWTKAVPVRT